ncbi:MAG: hypothetical protein ACR2PL_21925 [Dehalococcoidia bacterium]
MTTDADRNNRKVPDLTAENEEDELDSLLVSKEEGWAIFDDAARRTLGMSGEEFLAKLDADEFGDPDDDRRVMNMVFLLPFVREVQLAKHSAATFSSEMDALNREGRGPNTMATNANEEAISSSDMAGEADNRVMQSDEEEADVLGSWAMTEQEGHAYFDQQARKLLGMSAKEFLAKLDADGFGDPDDDRRVMDMIFLLPLVREVILPS